MKKLILLFCLTLASASFSDQGNSKIEVFFGGDIAPKYKNSIKPNYVYGSTVVVTETYNKKDTDGFGFELGGEYRYEIIDGLEIKYDQQKLFSLSVGTSIMILTAKISKISSNVTLFSLILLYIEDIALHLPKTLNGTPRCWSSSSNGLINSSMYLFLAWSVSLSLWLISS